MRLAKKLAAMFVTALIVLSMATFAFASAEYDWDELYSKIEKNYGRYIDKNIVFVIGYGVGPKGSNPNGSFYKSFARQAARFDAFNNLHQETTSSDVEAEITVNDGVIISEKFIIRVDSTLLNGVEQVGEAKFFEDVCKVIMKMPLPKKD